MNSPTLTIWRKELDLMLRRRSTWIIMATFLALLGFGFILALRGANTPSGNIVSMFCSCTLMLVPLPIALFTMPLFARERATGTLETLLTAPVSDAQIVIGKFMAAFSMIAIMLCVSIAQCALYRYIATPSPSCPAELMALGMGAVAIATMAWTSIGLFISLLVRHEGAAGAATMLIVSLSAAAISEDFLGIGLGNVASAFGVVDFARGIVDTRPVWACFSTTVCFLFTSVRILESRKWASRTMS